jgi:hypothetical protein
LEFTKSSKVWHPPRYVLCTKKKTSQQPVNHTYSLENRKSRHLELVNTPIKTDRKRGRMVMALGMGVGNEDEDEG